MKLSELEPLYNQYRGSSLTEKFSLLEKSGLCNPKDLAKPKTDYKGLPITIFQHTENVINELIDTLNQRMFVVENVSKFVGISIYDIIKELLSACLLHDLGKSHPLWRNCCHQDFHNSTNTLLTSGIRHELIYLPLLISKDICILKDSKIAAIAAHHGKLSEYHTHRFDEIETIIKNSKDSKFKKIIDNEISLLQYFKTRSYNNSRLSNPLDDIEFLRTWYLQAFMRYYLQFADKRASIKESGDEVKTIEKFTYKFPHNSLNNVQKLAVEHSDKKLLLIRSQTGGGKTDASLLWAAEKIKSGLCDRVVIAMPTMFTSNALSLNIKDYNPAVGVYHSTAAMKNSKLDTEWAKNLEVPITVCTIDHLLSAMTLNREEHHGILFNLTNSCLIIDEADFYDDFIQANILTLLKFLKQFNVSVLIMSATLPDSFLELCKNTGYEIDYIVEDTSMLDVKRSNIADILYDDMEEDFEDLLPILKRAENEPTIIYANTIERAKRYYSYCKKHNVKILYHSNFTEEDKELKEHFIIEQLGKKSWDKGLASGVVILTQIGEMSINICSVLMICDIAPFDRLVQRLGRLARFFPNKLCDVYIVIPFKSGKIYPAPYGHYDNEEHAWLANKAFKKTVETIKLNFDVGKKHYTVKDYVNIVNKIYPKIEIGYKGISNAKILEDNFKNCWLLQPKVEFDETNNTNGKWKSRDIENTDTLILTETPPEINSILNYTFFKQRKSVKVKSNGIEKLLKAGIIKEEVFIVSGEKMNAYVLTKPEYYNKEIGGVEKMIKPIA